MDKKFYGLILPKKVNKVERKTKSIFDSSDDESEAPSCNSKKAAFLQSSSKSLAKNLSLQKKIEKDDPTVYEYDSIYDSIKEKQTEKQKSTKKQGPKYIENLLKASEKRKHEQERRQERKIQSEREKEGDEFKDKEAFVTSAYKKKMLEMQEEEEREKLQDQIDEMTDVRKQNDLSGFYRHYLKQTVGEEKVPEFGERESKIKELCKRIKKEKSPSPKTDIIPDISVVPDLKQIENPDADSYSSSEQESCEEITHGKRSPQAFSHSVPLNNKNVDNLKTSNENVKILKSESCGSKSEPTEKLMHKHHKSLRDNDKSSSEDSQNDESENQVINKKRKSNLHPYAEKKPRQDDCDSKNHDKAVDELIIADNKSVNEPSNDDDVKQIKTKPKYDMRLKFIKRTVAEIFDQAQARYFQRIAIQNRS